VRLDVEAATAPAGYLFAPLRERSFPNVNTAIVKPIRLAVKQKYCPRGEQGGWHGHGASLLGKSPTQPSPSGFV
jgi:hypothetical protein